MPIYAFHCPCGHTDEVYTKGMSISPQTPDCPSCHKPMSRNIVAEHGAPRNADAPGYLSDALGVSPHQIAEARKRFPHHEFASDGRMIIHNRKHRDRVLKDLGYIEYDKRDLKTQ